MEFHLEFILVVRAYTLPVATGADDSMKQGRVPYTDFRHPGHVIADTI